MTKIHLQPPVSFLRQLNSTITNRSLPNASRSLLRSPHSYHTIRLPAKLAIHSSPLTFRDHFHTTHNMSSDADYAAFLDKANQDTGGNKASTQSKSVGTKSVNTEVPKALQEIEEYYVSDADEPFEPVSLKYKGDSIPSANELAKLLYHDSEVSSISEKEFDPRGQYKKIIDAVKKEGSKDVSIFKVEHGGTRLEYYIVSLDKKNGRLVGLKALAVES